MLSIFPDLYSYSYAVPLIFRLVIGTIFLLFGCTNILERENRSKTFEQWKLRPAIAWIWVVSVIEIVTGIMLVAGLYTQIAALVLSVILALFAFAKKKDPSVTALSLQTILLLFLITLSLLFLGAGFYAYDLPL